jgi:hypothetical protein
MIKGYIVYNQHGIRL